MKSGRKERITAAIGSRRRLEQWFDDARKRRDAARLAGNGRIAILEIMAAFRRDILGGSDRHLVHRIPLPCSSSGEETVYLFPGHRAIYEIRTLWGRRHCFIVFIECDQDAGSPQPEDRNIIEDKPAADLGRAGRYKAGPTRRRRLYRGLPHATLKLHASVLILGFYKIMLSEIQGFLAKGRIDDAVSRYSDLKRQLQEAVAALVDARHDLANLPLPVREMVWYCLWNLLHDQEELLSFRGRRERTAYGRIWDIAKGLGLDPAAELAAVGQIVAPLEPILLSINLRPHPTRPEQPEKRAV